MFQKIINKIHNFFSPLLKQKDPEKGIGIIAACLVGLGIAGVVAIGAAIAKSYGEELAKMAEGLMLGIGNIILVVTSAAAILGGKLLEFVTSEQFLSVSITRDPVVQEGWTIVRDFSNMIIVLGFVVIGIATILRIKEYQAQKTLLPLILIALLINFTPLICGLMIDGANITMAYFLSASGGGGLSTAFFDSLNKEMDDQFSEGKAEKDVWKHLALCVTIAFFNIVVAVVFFLFAFLFAFRPAVLMCLVILSPLAFVCRVFPATRKIWTTWWTQFLQWTIIGIPAAFFIYLAGRMLYLGSFSASFWEDSLLSFFVPCIFLLIGYFLSMQTGALGAGAVMGVAGATGLLAVGASKFAGKRAWGGAKKAGGAIAQTKTGGNLLEKVRMRKPGATGAAQRKGIDDAKKRVEGMSSKERDRLITKRRVGRGGRIDQAAALEIAAEKGELTNAHKVHVTGAQSLGLNISKIEKSRPDWTPDLESKKVKNLQTTINPTTRTNYTSDEAERKVIEDTVTGMSSSEVTKTLHSDALRDVRVAGSLSAQQAKAIGNRGITSQVDELKKYRPKLDRTTGKLSPLSRQTPEFRAFRTHVRANYPVGSPERARVAEFLRRLGRDRNFH